MRFARTVFLVAGLIGSVILVPQYFIEQGSAPMTHPEFFYGFLGVAVAFQVVFLIISTDPRRFRPMMIASVLEKFSFAGAVFILFFSERVPAEMAGAGVMDLTFGILFCISFFLTRESASGRDGL